MFNAFLFLFVSIATLANVVEKQTAGLIIFHQLKL